MTILRDISPEKYNIALQLVRSMLGPTKARPGCAGITFYQDTDAANTMILLEEWEDWTSMEGHIRSESYRNILALMDLSNEQPDIRMYEISKIEGMKIIEGIRA